MAPCLGAPAGTHFRSLSSRHGVPACAPHASFSRSALSAVLLSGPARVFRSDRRRLREATPMFIARLHRRLPHLLASSILLAAIGCRDSAAPTDPAGGAR